MLIKAIATILGLLLIGCAPTATPPPAKAGAKARKPRPMPNLDRTYDWGARPPVQSPDRDKD
jgi:hypothetical protein